MKNSIIKISPLGYKESKRKSRDGKIFFGVILEGKNQDEPFMNDFVLPLEESGFGKRHFVVQYSTKDDSYYVKDLADGTGTFTKIIKPMKVSNGNILSFGDSHLVANISSSEKGKNEKISVKFLEGPKAEQIFNFDSSFSPITIGRVESNKICIKTTTLSRHQCELDFTSDGNWVVIDGDGSKHSTNGTWAFMEQLFVVYEGMIFKAGQTLFECHLSNSIV